MPGLKLKTSLPPSVIATGEREGRGKPSGLSLRTKIPTIESPPPPAEPKPAMRPDPSILVIQAVGSLRNEVAEMHTAMERMGENIVKRISSDVAARSSDLGERLGKAMEKTPITFDIRRDGDGRIKSVVARPA